MLVIMMNNVMLLTFVIVICFQCLLGRSSTLPRGLPISKKSFYREGQIFTCLDGTGQLPWTKVNDDYCDCLDGSDEPGTSACTNGIFYCANRDYRSKFIPSSRVDDGICDCCDGSDEYREEGKCVNTCWEQGRAAREESERRQKLYEEGVKIHAEYLASVEGQLKEKRQRLETLALEISALAAKRASAEETKNTLEAPEKEAVEKHRKAWEERREAARLKRDAVKAQAAFVELDKNLDNQVDISELQRHMEFDKDANGEVGVEEAREYLADLVNASNIEERNVDRESENLSANLEEFREKVWPRIKDLYKIPAAEAVEDEGAGEDQEDNHEKEKSEASKSEDEEKEPEHDEETKKLISAAEEAREAFKLVDERHRNLEAEKQDLDKLLSGNYGPDNIYLNLAVINDCFEFSDREYTYKMCPFRDITQIRKDGGGTTSLGNWGQWQQNHSIMLFEKGDSCWNGPARSTQIKLHCGPKNELISATEPSRCEYVMEMNTPAACGGKSDVDSNATTDSPNEEAHDEL